MVSSQADNTSATGIDDVSDHELASRAIFLFTTTVEVKKMGFDITGLGSVADLVTATINKIWPDKTEQEKQQIAAAVSLVHDQLEINKTEASHASVFVAGWRPSIGWVCSSALAFQFVVKPVLVFIFTANNHPVPDLPGIEGELWQLLMGMLGLSGLRTFEKTKKVS